MTLFIGVDPGRTGGIAAISPDMVVTTTPMPDNSTKLWRELSLLKTPETRATIERVSFFKMGRTGAGNYGIHYGEIRMALIALSIPFIEVMPQQWKKEILAGTDKTKEAAIRWCYQQWPGLNLIPEGKRKESDGIADALCMAEYGRRKAR